MHTACRLDQERAISTAMNRSDGSGGMFWAKAPNPLRVIHRGSSTRIHHNHLISESFRAQFVSLNGKTTRGRARKTNINKIPFRYVHVVVNPELPMCQLTRRILCGRCADYGCAAAATSGSQRPECRRRAASVTASRAVSLADRGAGTGAAASTAAAAEERQCAFAHVPAARPQP